MFCQPAYPSTAVILFVLLVFLDGVYIKIVNTSVPATSNCSTIINPHNFDYRINSPQPCSRETKDRLDLLVWIHSAPENTRERSVVRETWANRKHFPASIDKVRVIFFLGDTKSTKIQDGLYYESELYRDIVQETYMDSYKNLTYKFMSAMKWITHYCPNTKLILKADDDTVVDTRLMLQQLAKTINYPENAAINTFLCSIMSGGKPIREKDNKWEVTLEEYPRSEYPKYCFGFAVLISPGLIPTMWELSLRTKYFWIDDAFLGLLAEQMHVDINWISLGSHYKFGVDKPEDFYDGQNNCYIFGHTAHRVSVQYKIGSMLLAKNNDSDIT